MANAGRRGRPIAPLVLSAEERGYLERQVRRHRIARSLSERCRVILRCAEGLASKDVAAELGLHEHTVGKWRRRFLKQRCEGLLGEAVLADLAQSMMIRLPPSSSGRFRTMPSDVTHWSTCSMARRRQGFPTPRSEGSGPHRLSLTVSRLSNCPVIRCSSTRFAILSAYIFSAESGARPPASMRRARSRPLIATSRCCR